MTTDVYVGGLPFSSAGALQVIPRPSKGVGTNVAKVRGIAVELAGGMVYVADAETRVPSDAFYMSGIALTADGAIYVTQSSTGTFFWTEGVKVRSDGAVFITNGAPVAGTWGWLGAQGADGGVSILGSGFAVNLQASLNPWLHNGSGTPTFTRATVAYQTDFEGKLNLALSGEARFQGARRVVNTIPTNPNSWTSGTLTVSGSVADPDGGTTAYRVTATGADQSIVQILSALAVTDTSLRNTLWIRRATGTGQIWMFNGVHPAGKTDVTAIVTSAWQRIDTGTQTAAGGGTEYIGVQIHVSGDALDIWHGQTEVLTGRTNQNPSEYVSVGVLSAPYHGAGVDGVKYFSTLNGNTVSSNVVTEATGAVINSSASAAAGGVTAGVVDASGPLGEIDEPSQANVLGTTAAIVRTMSDAGWVASNITKGTATGADGVASAAASLTATAGNGTVLYTTVLGAAVRTYVPLVRRKTGTGVIDMTVDNGATWTPITLTASYKPFTLTTASVANPIIGFRIVTNTDAIEVDFNDLVVGTIAPAEPVPVNVTTAADVKQYVSANNISSTSTTIALSLTPMVDLGSTTVFHWASYVDANNYTALLSDGTNLIARKRISSSNHDATIAFTRTPGMSVKAVARFDDLNGVDVWLNTTKGTGDSTLTASQLGANFQIGADGNGANQDYCMHRFFQAYKLHVSDAFAAGLPK